jgi:hypothetical protein
MIYSNFNKYFKEKKKKNHGIEEKESIFLSSTNKNKKMHSLKKTEKCRLKANKCIFAGQKHI